MSKKGTSAYFTIVVLLFTVLFAAPLPARAQDQGDLSADLDGDGLSNEVEESGWYNAAGGPYVTDPLDADSDDDGLNDGQEKLYDTNPLNDRSPGIYVEYQESFQTKEYFPWQRFGNKYIALPTWGKDAVVVRRGATFSVGGPADATLEISKSLTALSDLTVARDPCTGRWNISVPTNGTVGIYTATVRDGTWNDSLNIYVIFQLPTDLGDAFVETFIYNNDPDNARDDYSVHYSEDPDNREYDTDDYAWIPEDEWVNHGYGWKFENRQYKDYVFEDHVMPAINGHTNTWDATNALAERADAVTCVYWPRYYNNSWCVLNPSSCGPYYDNRNECTTIASLLTAFCRGAGIPARPVFTDWRHNTWDHSTEVWARNPSSGNWGWYVARGYAVLENPCASPQVAGGYRSLRNTLGWYSGQGVYAANETWPLSEVTNYWSVSTDDFRQGSWDNTKIVKKSWWETRFRAYWGWTSEPEVTGTPPDDWPAPPGSLMAMEGPVLDPTAALDDVQINAAFQFNRVVADRGIDLDGDGRFDQLVFDIQVTVARAGSYWVRGRLADNEIEAIGHLPLEPGRYTIELPFDGHDIYMNKVDGPYVLDALWVTDAENPDMADFAENVLDFAEPAYKTSPYKFGDFGTAGAILSGEYSHAAVDTDKDGHADTLVVNTALKVEKPGAYTVQGVLTSGQDDTPIQATWTGNGPDVVLQFTGLRGTAGPYALAHLHVRNADGQVTDGIKEPHPLGAIPELSARPVSLGKSANSSSPIIPLFVVTPDEYSDSGLDTDGDGQFDQLVITTTVVVESGEGGRAYRLEGWLADQNGSLVAFGDSEPQVLAEGAHYFPLTFDGRIISEHGVDGPFTLIALKVLSGTTYTVLAEENVACTTSAYNHEQFEAHALARAASLFGDDMESGASQWTADAPWQLTDQAWHSYSHTWEANVAGSGNGSLIDAASLDVSAYAQPTLRVQTCYNMQAANDAGYLEVSANGSPWTRVATYTNATNHWATELIDLSDLGETSNVRFRFNANSQTGLLWRVDDVYLNAWPAITAASFEYLPQPALTNADTRFVADYVSIDTTLPITYTWNWGDGSPIVVTNASTTTHQFSEALDYTVHLTVENPYDSAFFSDVVSVYEPVSATSFDFASVTPFSDWEAVFTATYTSSSATQPVTFTWDFGGVVTTTTNEVVTYTFPGTNTYVVLLTTGNGYGTDVTATHTIVAPFDNDGDGLSNASEGAWGTDPNNPDSDGDGLLDGEEVHLCGTDPTSPDSDEDGITDDIEVGNPNDPTDSDQDGIINALDPDDDDDDIPTIIEGDDDADDDGTPNYLDDDSDGDGIPDSTEGSDDADDDGTPNFLDDDSDGDNIPDSVEGVNDVDSDGTSNFLDDDSDGDGLLDIVEGIGDADGDGLPNYLDNNYNPTDITLSNASVAENQPAGTTVGVLDTFDLDSSDTHTYTLVSGAGGDDNDAFVIDGDTLNTALSFDYEMQNIYHVRIKTDDSHGADFEKPFTVTVSNANDAPQFTSAPVTTATEDVAYTCNVTAADVDAGDTLTITATTLPAWLSLTDHGDGTATLGGTPANADVGDHAVTLRVRDVAGATHTQSFTVTVSNVNDAPQFTSAPVTTATEDVAYTCNVTAADVDAGDTLTITATTLPAWLSLADHGDGTATLSGTPANADVGDHAVTLRVRDVAGATHTQSFTVTVSNVNDAPQFTSAPVTTATEDVAYTCNVTAADVDAGDTLTITATTLPAWLTLADHGDGTATLSGTPTDAELGSHPIILQVRDAAGLTGTQSFTITVNEDNYAPQFTSAPVIEATENVLYTYNITATDANVGDVLVITAPISPTWLSLADHGDGTATLSGTPANADVGDHAVTLRVRDVAGATHTQSFTVTVSNVNDAPQFTSAPVTTATEDVAYTCNVTAADVDAGDTLTITATTLPAWLSLTDHGDGTATLGGTPANADVGDHAVTLRVRDVAGATHTQSFTVTVSNVNDAPQFTSAPVTTATEDVAYTCNVTAADVDAGDTLTITATTLPAWLTLADHGDGTATLSGTPTDAELGSHPIILQVRDAAGLTGTQSFTITVNEDNYAPQFTSAPVIEATENVLYTYNITATDANVGDVLVITAPISPTWLSLADHGDGTATLSGTPANADVGDHAVTLRVRDVAGATHTQSFTVTVSNVNDAPQFTSAPVTTATEDVAYTCNVTAADVDAGDTLTITATTLPAWLSLTDHGDGTATLGGTPANADVGDHAVTLRVRDVAGATHTQSFTVTVSNVNDAPQFTSAPVTTATEDVAYTCNVTAADVDAGDTLTITATTLPAWLSLTDHGDGTATLGGTPANADVGQHTVELHVTDAVGEANVQQFTIVVKAVGSETYLIYLPLVSRNN